MEERNYKVYMHINKINNKKYIGITKLEPKKRWANGRGYKSNKYFTNAINKYGWNEGFEHNIIKDNLTEKEAKDLEIHLIDLYDTTNKDKGYNITLGGEGANGLIRTEEWKQQLSEANSGENNPMYGKERTEEWKQQHSERMSGENNPMYGKHHTEETRKKMSKTKEDAGKSVICITTKRIFFSQKKGAECYNMKSTSDISRCCKKKVKSAGKDKNGTPLVWRKLVVNHNKTLRGKDISKLHSKIDNKEVA